MDPSEIGDRRRNHRRRYPPSCGSATAEAAGGNERGLPAFVCPMAACAWPRSIEYVRSLRFVSSSKLTGVTHRQAAGIYDVLVRNPGKTEVILPRAFRHE